MPFIPKHICIQTLNCGSGNICRVPFLSTRCTYTTTFPIFFVVALSPPPVSNGTGVVTGRGSGHGNGSNGDSGSGPVNIQGLQTVGTGGGGGPGSASGAQDDVVMNENGALKDDTGDFSARFLLALPPPPSTGTPHEA